MITVHPYWCEATIVGRLLQTHTLIGQEELLASYDWTRATELYLLSYHSMSLYLPFTPRNMSVLSAMDEGTYQVHEYKNRW